MGTMNCDRTLNRVFIRISLQYAIRASVSIVEVSAVFSRKVDLTTVFESSVANIVDISAFAFYSQRMKAIISLVEAVIVSRNENIATQIYDFRGHFQIVTLDISNATPSKRSKWPFNRDLELLNRFNCHLLAPIGPF